MAMFFGAAVFFLTYTGHVTSGDCTICVATLSALYKASNVIDKKFGGAG